jgi:hypothetical protein
VTPLAARSGAKDVVRAGRAGGCAVKVEGGTAGHVPSIVLAGNLCWDYEAKDMSEGNESNSRASIL